MTRALSVQSDMIFGRAHRTGKSIGFALAGGGARAASQVGALRALTEAGIWPQQLTGTSAGAVNAAWYALHPHHLDRLEAIWMGLRTRDVFPGGRLRILLNLTRSGYVHRVDAWEAMLRRHFGGSCFEDAALPCAVVAVRLSDGERVLFDQGDMVPALMASTAIPGVFPPHRIGDELYVDGGLLEYLPVQSLLDRGATTVYALDCSHFPIAKAFRGSVQDRCDRIAASASVAELRALSAARGCTIHVLRPELPACSDGRDFSMTAESIAAGYRHAHHYLRERLEVGSPSHL